MHEFLIAPWTKPITALHYSKKKAQVVQTKLSHLPASRI